MAATLLLTGVAACGGSSHHAPRRPTTTSAAPPGTGGGSAPGPSGGAAGAGGGGPSGPVGTAGGGPGVAPGFAAFVGTWQGHGTMLTMTAGGTGTASWRVYRFCSIDPTPPCDDDSGGQLRPGGRATLALTAGGGGTAQGTVTGSTDPGTLPNGPVTVTIEPGDVLAVTPGDLRLCGPQAAAGACGA